MKVYHLLRPGLIVLLSLVVVATAVPPAISTAGWTDGMPCEQCTIKSAEVVTISRDMTYYLNSVLGGSYYNIKYDDTWEVAQKMACVFNGWDCNNYQVPIVINSAKAISYEAYVSVGGVEQAPTVAGSFGNSGGKISLSFTVNGMAWQKSTVVFVVKTKNGTVTYTLPKTGLTVSV